MEKGTIVYLLRTHSPYKKGARGIVLAVRTVKESDTDVQALKKNGIQMALGSLALVRFSRGRHVIPVTDLTIE